MKVYRSKKAAQMLRKTYDDLLLQWEIPVEEKDIKSPFGSTHILIAGEPKSKPLILFHGVGDDSALMWLYNAKALAAKYRIYAVDTIGGPGKSKPGEKYNKTFDATEWIDSILAEFHLDSVGVIGTSHGAYLAQYYGANRPQCVEKIVCLSGAIPVGNPMKTMMKIFLPEALFPTRRNTEKLLRKLSGNYCDVFLKNETIMEHYQWLLKGFNNMAMRYHAIKPLTDEQINNIRPKTLYINGNDDPFQLLAGKAVLEQYKMQSLFFDHVGHGINHEISEQVNEILLDAF